MTRKPASYNVHHVFFETVKQIPEWKLKAIEINRLLKTYNETLRNAAEMRLRERMEPLTEHAVDVEMSRIDTETAHAVAQDYAEGKGVFAEYKTQKKQEGCPR